MRISDWSSDVCSSDLSGRDGDRDVADRPRGAQAAADGRFGRHRDRARGRVDDLFDLDRADAAAARTDRVHPVLRYQPGRVDLGLSLRALPDRGAPERPIAGQRSEEHKYELQSLM